MALWAFDLETYLITGDNTAPKPVVASWWCGQGSPFLTRPGDDATISLVTAPYHHFVGQNIAYDIVVMMRWQPWSIPFWVRALEEGRVWDTQIRQQLMHLETKGGHGFPGRISLADLVQLYLQKDVSADKKGDDVWRLKYGTLDGVPFDQWPSEATRYALDDAVHTWQVFWHQGGIDAQLPTETLQNQAAVVLSASSAWGIYTNQPAVHKHQDELVPKIKQLTHDIEHLDIVGKGSKEKLQNLVSHGWRQLHLQLIERYCHEWNLGLDTQALQRACAIGDIPKWWLQYHHQQHWHQLPPIIWDQNGWNPQDHLERLMNELPDVPCTKTGLATGEDQIEPIIDLIPALKTRAELKHLEKMYSTYVVPYLNQRAVHPRFRPVITTGRTACEKPNCYSLDTEILTSEGWRSFEECRENPPHSVAQYDKGIISFVSPQAWYFSSRPEEVLTFHKQYIDLCVTPEHRCLFINRRNKRFFWKPASQFPSDMWHVTAGEYAGGGGVPLSDSALEILLAVQAGAHWNGKRLDWDFTKKKKSSCLLSLLSEEGFQYTVTYDCKRNRTRVRSSDPALLSLCREYLGSPPTKLFGKWIFSLSKDQASLLMRRIMFWDGCGTRKNHYAFNHKVHADWVQILFLLNGVRATVRAYQGPRNLSYQVDVAARSYCGTANVVRGHGNVFVGCCKVPSGAVVVRRNGKVSISGNCQNIPATYRDVVCPRPNHLYGTIDYSGIEMVTLASTIVERYGESRLADAINAGYDLHCLTASSLVGCSYEEMFDKAKRQKIPEWVAYRQSGKPSNFGLPGGLGVNAFIAYAKTNYGVIYSPQEARDTIKKWKQTWPDIDRYLKDNGNLIDNSEGRLATAINNSGRKKANCTYTELSNYPFQSLAADGAKASMFAMWKDMILGWWWTEWAPLNSGHPSLALVGGYGQAFTGSPLRYSHIANFVHDEIMCEHPEQYAEEAFALQERYMVDTMQAFNPRVKVTVEGHLGREWSH